MMLYVIQTVILTNKVIIMEEVNLSAPCMMKQIKILTQQLLRLSEDLELAHERISVLEKDFETHKSELHHKHPVCKMNILHSKVTGL
jgi:hypothetical protein